MSHQPVPLKLDLTELDTSPEIVVPVAIQRRGVEKKLILDSGHARLSREPDMALIAAVTNARTWFEQLLCGEHQTLRDIAQAQGKNERYIAQIIRLAFLDPFIIKQIINGEQPVDLTLEKLRKPGKLPMRWDEQRKRLGINP